MKIVTKTPTGTEFEAEIDSVNERILITSKKGNQHEYMLRALRDLYIWLRVDCGGKWIYLGSKGEEEIPNQGTVEKWARCDTNPVGGFYGVTVGRRGRFASYVPSILEALGFLEVEHNPKNNRARAL